MTGAIPLGATTSYTVHTTEVPWTAPHEGVKVRELWCDPETGRAIRMVQLGCHAVLESAESAGDSVVYVLEGELEDDEGAVSAGNLRRYPAAAVPWRSARGVTYLLFTFAVPDHSGRADQDTTPLTISPHTLDWAANPPHQVQTKLLWQDDLRRFVLARQEPGFVAVPHRHIGDEMLFVLEGAVEDENSVALAGELAYRPPGCAHTPASRIGSTSLVVVYGGDSELLTT